MQDYELILQELESTTTLLETSNELSILLIASVFLAVGSILGLLFMFYLKGR